MERRGGSVEAKGRTVEEAVDSGLAQLGLTRADVEVEILSRGSRGVFGIGAEEARVRLTPLGSRAEPAVPGMLEVAAESEPQEYEPYVEAPEGEAEEEVEEAEGEEEEEGWPEAPEGAGEMAPEEVQAIAQQALSDLLARMSIEAEVVAKPAAGYMVQGSSSPSIVLDIRGEDLGVLIGRRGETLGALQYLVRLIVNHRTRRWYNIAVDVEGYKERREKQLRQLAERMAERVVATQRSVTLEAMPAYERRIVHLALRDHPQVTTHSIGEGENRKVMILLRS